MYLGLYFSAFHSTAAILQDILVVFPGPRRRCAMENPRNRTQDRLKQIADELIRLYRRQLTLWVLGKIDNLNEADLRKYDRRQRRIEQLRRELELIAEYGELHSA
jgi:hypothetical protein